MKGLTIKTLKVYLYDKNSYSKKIILIGDAEPHSVPRKTGKYSKQLIEKLSKEKQIEINAIITPDDKERGGRS